MRTLGFGSAFVAIVLLGSGPMQAAVKYPLTLVLDAQLKSGVTTITSKVTVRAERPMDDSRRTRAADALKFSGYSNFVNTLRPYPSIGSIETQGGKVDIRYGREDQEGEFSRLVLIADRPIFFLNKDTSKPRAGYELTVMELRIDGKGAVSGQMAGAARVRPAPEGQVLLDTYSEELVLLKGQVGTP